MAHKRTIRVASNRDRQSKLKAATAHPKRAVSSAAKTTDLSGLLLYNTVYRSRYTVFVTGLLCLCFLVQPLHQAYAETNAPADVVSTTTPSDSETDTEPLVEAHVPQSPEPVPTIEEEESTTTDETMLVRTENDTSHAGVDIEPTTDSSDDRVQAKAPDTDLATSSATTTQQDEEGDATNESLEPASSTASTAESETDTIVVAATTTQQDEEGDATNESLESASSTASTAEPETDTIVTSSTSTSSPRNSTSTEVDSATSSNTTNASSSTAAANLSPETQPTDASNSSSVSEKATTSTADGAVSESVDTEESAPLVSVVENDTHLAFSREECMSIEDGSFYCQPRGDNTSPRDRLLAAPDADGDLEIYLLQSGERRQISDNQVDDAAPYYDPVSETIVWHRMINDRYQIVSYDTSTGDEIVLTNNRVNDMEPARHGDRIVWQRWVDDNWEIMLRDNGEVTQITNSPEHDLAPHVRGPLIIWNSRYSDGSQALKTYDIDKQTITTIGDESGVSVANPRMVVMYEAMYENGDVVAKGFDIVSGEVVPLHSLPRELPDELPDSDSTGETRALIQSKPSLKQTDDSRDDDTSGSADATATASTTDTLDLRQASSTAVASTATSTPTGAASSTIPDLVLPATTTSASSSQSQAE